MSDGVRERRRAKSSTPTPPSWRTAPPPASSLPSERPLWAPWTPLGPPGAPWAHCHPGTSVGLVPREPVEAPRPAAGGGQVKKDEAVEHRQLALIEDGIKPARGVGVEIGHRHGA